MTITFGAKSSDGFVGTKYNEGIIEGDYLIELIVASKIRIESIFSCIPLFVLRS